MIDTHGAHPFDDGRGDYADDTQPAPRWQASRQAIEILSRIHDCFLVFDREWRFLYLNPKGENYVGRTLDDLEGKILWEEFPQLVGTIFEENYRKVMETREMISFEVSSLLYPGRWTSVRAYPSDAGLEIYLHDITERRRALDALWASEERLRLVANSLPVLISFVDADHYYRFNNEAYAEWFGDSPSDITGKHLLEVLGDEAYKTVLPLVNRVLDGERVNFETKVVYKKAGERNIHGTYVPCRRPDGTIEGFAALIVDISERKRDEEALRMSEERFRLMADSAPVLIWMSDTTNLGTWFNKPWLDFVGRTMEQEAGVGWAEGVHADDYEHCVTFCSNAFNMRQSFTMEFRLRRHDGEYRWMLDTGIPLYSPAGEFTGYIGSCIDITDRKQAEQERDRLLESERGARSEAERASRVKDEFLATLSHELRTPLTSILGWAHLLRSRQFDSTEVMQGLEVIERNARMQTQIIEDLLDMSRIISGKISLKVRRVELPSVIEAALETVRPAAEAKGIRLQTTLDSSGGPVMGDPGRLQQIVWNLLSNAIKFTPANGHVQVSLEQVDSHVEIAVADTGQGIRLDFLPHVFERFRQADSTTTRSHGGLGLGLAIVKNLVELHGGSVGAKSPGEGNGATFIVKLPVATVHAEEESRSDRAAISTSQPVDSEQPMLDEMTILVVDDEPDARDLLRRVLEECGASVVTASSVREGLHALRDHRPNVIVSDIGMPEEDGFDLIRIVRGMEPDEGGTTPAIALTAFARSEDRRRVLLAGFQMHVAKPVEPSELVAVIAGVVGR